MRDSADAFPESSTQLAELEAITTAKNLCAPTAMDGPDDRYLVAQDAKWHDNQKMLQTWAVDWVT